MAAAAAALAFASPPISLPHPARSPNPTSLLLPPLLRSPHRRILASFPRRRVSRRRLRPAVVVAASATGDYEFLDNGGEVELRMDIGKLGIESSKDVFVEADDTSLLARANAAGTSVTLVNVNRLYERIKPSETIWYIDEDQLVVNLKKVEADLKWPNIDESWETLCKGVPQLLKGTSLYVVGDHTEINNAVAKELATGIGYVPFFTSDILRQYADKSIDSWLESEGPDSVAAAEATVLESLSSHVRTVVGTLGGEHGAASRFDSWRHLYAGFTIWLSISNSEDQESARAEAQKHMNEASVAYTNAEIVVKLGGSAVEHSQIVAEGCLLALKQLTIGDKKLAGKKNLYVRLGCRGDWPNIKAPGWDPSTREDPPADV